MKVLIQSIIYRPEPTGFRTHDLAAGLVELGHEVVAVVGLPSYPFGRVYDGYKIRLRQWESIDGVHILRVPYVMDRSKSAIRRICSYTWFSVLSVMGSLLLNWHPDVMWTNQVGFPGLFLRPLLRIPVVHEVQDLWPEWSKTADLGITAWSYRILDWVQMQVYRNASAITCISDGFKGWLANKGVPASKIEVVPNWVDSAQYHSAMRDEVLGQQEGLAGHFNVMYGGNIGLAQALDVLPETASLLADLPEVQFIVIGDGVERLRLEQIAADNGLRNLRFLGTRPSDRMVNYYAWADVLLLHLMSNPAYDITIPSKTYSYLASGRPILAAAAGDVATLVGKYDVGVVVPPQNPKALADAIRQLYAMPKSRLELYGENAARAYNQHFGRDVLVRRYETVFRRVASSL